MIQVAIEEMEMGPVDLGHLVMDQTMAARNDPRIIQMAADHPMVEEDHLMAHLVVEDRLTARQMDLVTRGMGKTNLTKKTVQPSKKWRILLRSSRRPCLPHMETPNG